MEMSAIPWRQVSLPVSLGGLGIRRTEELALSAYLASIHSVASLVSDIFPMELEALTRIPLMK